MADRVLVDTSAWIDFFRRKDPELHELAASLLREGYAAVTGVITLELFRGAKTKRELNVISDLLETVHMVFESSSTHEDAGKMGYELARKGQTLAVVDLIIAQIALENDLSLLTLDKHFLTISESFPLKLLPLNKNT